MTNQFVIGCTHFDDLTILPFRKQFKSVDDMHSKLVASWNSRVSDNDTVYILGDFALRRIDYWARELKGKKILIAGNHDKMPVHAGYFESVEPLLFLRTPIIGTQDKPQEVFLYHYPCISWEGKHEGSVHLHAHSHGKLESSLASTSGPARLDVSVDCWDQWPIPLEMAITAALNKTKR